MGFAVPVLAAVAVGTSIAGAISGAQGARQASNAQAQAATYNSEVDTENAQVQAQNATLAIQAGEAQAGIQSQKTAAAVGNLKANQGASGVDIGSGSSTQVVSSAKELGQVDALTVRRNAALQAYGYEVQSTNDKAQAQIGTMAASNDIAAGNIAVTSTLINGIGGAASNFAKFQEAGGLGSFGGSSSSSNNSYKVTDDMDIG